MPTRFMAVVLCEDWRRLISGGKRHPADQTFFEARSDAICRRESLSYADRRVEVTRVPL